MSKQKEFKEYVHCGECPCLSEQNDFIICNLKYNTELMVNIDGERVYCSDNCKLNFIDYEQQIFEPDNIKATKDLKNSLRTC